MDDNERLARLEQRLEHLERNLTDERASGERRRQRERWLRIALFGFLALVYLLYFRSMSNL
ncbi:MAG: hypothetical protein O2816_03380 [Planctomycetota bacterium]|nr:hypothetical protein [Planctomycetota bacterium]